MKAVQPHLLSLERPLVLIQKRTAVPSRTAMPGQDGRASKIPI